MLKLTKQVATNIVGGPSERLLPESTLTENSKHPSFPLFCTLPVPEPYLRGEMAS
jgi:hypothetical protein